jgi:hypothetical protein
VQTPNNFQERANAKGLKEPILQGRGWAAAICGPHCRHQAFKGNAICATVIVDQMIPAPRLPGSATRVSPKTNGASTCDENDAVRSTNATDKPNHRISLNPQLAQFDRSDLSHDGFQRRKIRWLTNAG